VKRLALACACLFVVSGVVVAQSNPVPFISQPLVPESVAPGSGAFTLTVNGGGFAPTAAVRWNGALRPTTVLSRTLLQAQISARDVATAQTARVAVVNVDAHDETSDITFFPVATPAPSVGFVQNSNFPVTGDLGPIVPGDFNNDGKLDVANVYASSSTTLETDVYLSEGSVEFQPPIKTEFSGYAGLKINTVVTGDFNGDHHLDLGVYLSQNDVPALLVLFGDGAGGFTLGPNTDIGSSANSTPGSGQTFPVEDMDGDGNLDIVSFAGAMNNNGPQIYVLFGHGDGTFSAGNQICSPCGSPTVGDFNEDGHLDLVFTNNSGLLTVALNDGHGNFPKPKRTVYGEYGFGFAIADVNNDGHLDLVTQSGQVFLGTGDGSLVADGNVGTRGGGIFIADFNGDGKLDLVFPPFVGSSSVSVLLGNGDGTFQTAITTANGFSLNLSQGFGIDDFTNDGRLNLVGSAGLFWQAAASLTPVSLAFGQQTVGTKSAPQTATLFNNSGETLLGIQITLGGTDAQDFSQQNNCPSSLAVGASCEIQVVFAPTSPGDQTASLNAAYTGNGSPQSVALSGTGVADTSVSLLPAGLTFGNQDLKTKSAPHTATLTNTGNAAVTVTDISTAAPFFETNNCPSTLAAGKSCQIKVTFQPTTIGSANGTLSVADSAPDSPQTVVLSGVGTLITLSPIGINFGNQKVGTSSSPVPVTLSNQGTITLKISQIEIGGANAGDFSQTNNCGSSLAAGAQCTIQITFTPAQTGARSGELEVQDDVHPSPQDVALGGTGT
jgi:hypothetical protein